MIPRHWAHTLPIDWAELDRAFRTRDAGDPALIAQWEAAVAEVAGTPQTVAVSSGRRGMTLILKHLGVGAGDEVIVPAYTLADLIPLIEALGARAVPADIDLETFNLSPEAVQRRIRPETKAVMALHAFGAPCAVDRILEIAQPAGIPVIEDCAHALGATLGGRPVGSFGHAAFFSFEPTKPVNTFGGGIVASCDTGLLAALREATASGGEVLHALQKKVKAVRMEQWMFKTGLIFPFLLALTLPGVKEAATAVYRRLQPPPQATGRYLPVQAAIGLRKIAGLQERIETRNRHAERLSALLQPYIRPQRILERAVSTYYFFVVLLPCPASPVRRRLLLRGIDAAVGHEIADDCAALLGVTDCPNAAHVFRHAIALPMYEGLSEAELVRIATALNTAVG